MAQHRIPKENSKYYIPKEEYLTVLHYCRQYPYWEAELAAIQEGIAGSGIDTEKERVQSSNQFDPVSTMGIRMAAISKKKKLVDDAIHSCAAGMDKWIILGVCHGLTYPQLRQRGIPCSPNTYYKIRRYFYYRMSKII